MTQIESCKSWCTKFALKTRVQTNFNRTVQMCGRRCSCQPPLQLLGECREAFFVLCCCRISCTRQDVPIFCATFALLHTASNLQIVLFFIFCPFKALPSTPIDFSLFSSNFSLNAFSYMLSVRLAEIAPHHHHGAYASGGTYIPINTVYRTVLLSISS